MPTGYVQDSIAAQSHTGDTETEDATAEQGNDQNLHLHFPFELCAVRSLACSMSLKLEGAPCGI